MNRRLTLLFVSNQKAIDTVVREQSKALERERILAEEVIFFKDEVDRLELVLRKDNLKFLGIPETAQGVTRSVCAESS